MLNFIKRFFAKEPYKEKPLSRKQWEFNEMMGFKIRSYDRLIESQHRSIEMFCKEPIISFYGEPILNRQAEQNMRRFIGDLETRKELLKDFQDTQHNN